MPWWRPAVSSPGKTQSQHEDNKLCSDDILPMIFHLWFMGIRALVEEISPLCLKTRQNRPLFNRTSHTHSRVQLMTGLPSPQKMVKFSLYSHSYVPAFVSYSPHELDTENKPNRRGEQPPPILLQTAIIYATPISLPSPSQPSSCQKLHPECLGQIIPLSIWHHV